MSASSSSSSSSYWISLAGAALSGVLATVAVTNYWHTKTADQRSKESLMQILRDRRSIFPKQYSPHRVPRSVLLELLESARWAPTHKLTEPWSFVVFESLEGRTSVVSETSWFTPHWRPTAVSHFLSSLFLSSHVLSFLRFSLFNFFVLGQAFGRTLQIFV